MKKTLLILFLTTLLNAQHFSFGLYPSNTPEKLLNAFLPFTHYLTQTTGDTYELIITRDYRELAQRLENKTIDFAWLGSKNYIDIKQNVKNLQYITTYMEEEKFTHQITPYYRAFIVTLKKNNLQTLQMLKNKRFAFTDRLSTSGYAYPNKILKDNHINYQNYFSKYFFLKKHDRVIEALVNDSIDAGAISDGTYYAAVEKYGDIFHIIKQSDKIPLDVIVGSSNIDTIHIKKLADILNTIDVNSTALKGIKEHLGWNAAGFDAHNKELYDRLQKALE